MKNIIITISTILIFQLLSAQDPIIPLYTGQSFNTENAYYKDVNNVHSLYEGTWIYTNGSDTLKIKLRKRTMISISGHFANYYMDQLVGEYQYIENGFEKVNTLQNFYQEHIGRASYNLYGITLKKKNSFPKCNECADGEKRMFMRIQEPALNHLEGLRDEFIVRHYVENGVEKLKVWFYYYAGNIVAHKDTHELSNVNSFSLPYGEYILTKVE